MTDRTLGDIGSLIETRFRDTGFCVKTMCHEMGVSMSTLHEFMSVRYGTTPHTLIETRRLMEALKLMKDDYTCLGAVVFGCGFSSLRTFRRVFKKRIGILPSEAIERLRSSSANGRFHGECVRKLLKIGPPALTRFFMAHEKITGGFDRKKSILPLLQVEDNFQLS